MTKFLFDMKPEEQRIAIAKACGWLVTDNGENGRVMMGSRHGWKPGFKPDPLPDYLNDLNAMHEAKKTLTDEQRPIYWRTLYDVCKTTEWPFNAEAYQEAEAFLKTLNLWKE
jgi:hypothetical protein